MRGSKFVGGVLAIVGLAVGGCASHAVPGQPAAISVTARTTETVTTGITNSGCTDIRNADPSIAFQPSLQNDGKLVVGSAGWIDNVSRASDITVSGTPGAIALADQSLDTEVACGKVLATVSWVQITARRPGRVTLTIRGGTPRTLTITVVAG